MLFILQGFVGHFNECLCQGILPFLRVFIDFRFMCSDLQWSVKMGSFRSLPCTQNWKVFLVSKRYLR